MFRPNCRPCIARATPPRRMSALLLLATLGLVACGSKPVRPSETEAAAPPISMPSRPAAPAVKSDAERQAEFDRSMARWHGAKVQELVAKLGAPTSRAKRRSGQWIYTYARSTTVRGPTGPQRFSCVVNYEVDAQRETVVGHRIQGC